MAGRIISPFLYAQIHTAKAITDPLLITKIPFSNSLSVGITLDNEPDSSSAQDKKIF